MNREALDTFRKVQETNKMVKCYMCNDRDGFILVGEGFVCGRCVKEANEKLQKDMHDRMVLESAEKVLELLEKRKKL